MKLQKYMRGGLDVSEAAIDSLWTPYDDAQRALDAERERAVGLLKQVEGLEQGCFIHHVDREQLATLQAQLPAEMPGCTILFKECEKGHGRLTATNWIDHGCGTCALESLQAQLAAWQTGKMHICLLCGRDKPCMTDEEAIAEGCPGKPCTFDPTPRELFDENKRLKAQLAAMEGERDAARHRVDELESREIDVEILQGDLATLRQLVEVHTKQLTELTIIPIGCSREQELRWTQSIKDLRATLAAHDAGKVSTSIIGKQVPPSQWNKNAGVSGDVS